MDRNLADFLTKTLDELESADEQFRFNQENQIMNGYPIRIMDECKQKLEGCLAHALPDAATHPKLHAYMSGLRAAAEAKAEQQRKRDEHLQSPEGRREQRLKQIQVLQNALCGFERDHQTCQTEAANYVARAQNAKRSIELTKSILADLEAQREDL